MWESVKVVLRVKFVTLNIYIRKEERSKMNNLCYLPRKLEKENQIKSKGRRKEIIKIRAKINEIENRNSVQKMD